MANALSNPGLRDRLRRGEHLRGCFVKLAGLESIDLLAAVRADFAVIDLEHSPVSEEAAFAQVAYARALGLGCLVRVATTEAAPIGRWLDAGAAGVQAPDVADAGQAHRLVAACRYPPDGDRGISPSQRTGGYGARTAEALRRERSDLPLVVAQVERDLDDPTLDAIAGSGVDVLFVGHADLGSRLAGEGHDDVAGASAAVADRVWGAAGRASVASGWHGRPGAGGPPGGGGCLVTVATDVTMLADAMRTTFTEEGTR